MQQRKSSSSTYGRPSGTDGSDFSYRMVVDSRYTRVAKGKSRLSILILAQVLILFLGIFYILSTQKDEMINKYALLSTAAGQISLIVGELGRRRSLVNFLKFYMVVSSAAVIVSSACAIKDNPLLKDPSAWQSMKLELLGLSGAILGVLIQIFTITTTSALTTNMSPPKRAS
uniref:Uncharacterized protein n=1 Tax=Kalanchoe fedtschenkoi TaxID=63787 RepID=A0A7N0RGM2_KALFE